MNQWRSADLLSKARRATIDVLGPSSSIETGRPLLPEASRSLGPFTASSTYRFSRTVGGNVASSTAGAVANRRWRPLRPCRAPGRAAPRRSPSPTARWRADPVGARHGLHNVEPCAPAGDGGLARRQVAKWMVRKSKNPRSLPTGDRFAIGAPSASMPKFPPRPGVMTFDACQYDDPRQSTGGP